jgi:hypothetical protein
MNEIELWESEIANERSHTFEKLISQATFLTEAIDMDCKIIEQVELNEGAKEIFAGIWEKIKTAFSRIADFFIGLATKIKEKFSDTRIKAAEKVFNSSDSDDKEKLGESVDFLKEDKTIGSRMTKEDGKITFKYIIFDINAFDTSLKKFDIDYSFLKNFEKTAKSTRTKVEDKDEGVEGHHFVGSDDNQFYRQKEGKFASYLASEKILSIFSSNPKTLDDIKSINIKKNEDGEHSSPDLKYTNLMSDCWVTVSATNKMEIKYEGKRICKINQKMNTQLSNTYYSLGKYIKKISSINIKEVTNDDEMSNAPYIKTFSQIANNMIHVLRNDQKLASIIQTIYAYNFSTMWDMLKYLKKNKEI